MSVPAQIKELEELGNVKIKGNLSIEDLVRRQMDRCNMTISTADPEVFNANVRALMSYLPGGKYAELIAKKDEYNTENEQYNFRSTCGHDIGTIENPLVSVPNHPEWDFLLDIPKPYREEHEDEISILSPIKSMVESTDYEQLYRLIIKALEGQGLTWKIEQKTVEMGKVIKVKTPSKLLAKAEAAIVKVLTEARIKDSKINDIFYSEIIEDLRSRTPPPTPVM